MIELPLPTIAWGFLTKITAEVINRLKIDIRFERTLNNPSITVAYDIARVRYQLIVKTHGMPMIQPDVIFTKVKGLGEILKKAVSPSGLGEVDGSMRLKLYRSEAPSNSELPLNVDFEIKINPETLVTMAFSENREILDEHNPEIEVLCTNNCDFPLEQILLTVRKATSSQIRDVRVLILNKGSHRAEGEVDPIAIKKGDDYVKWMTRLNNRESILFKIVAME